MNYECATENLNAEFELTNLTTLTDSVKYNEVNIGHLMIEECDGLGDLTIDKDRQKKGMN